MKKLHVVCTVAILALAAMVLIGCDQPTSNPGNNPSNPGDSWTKVETVDGLEGVWKSSVTQAFSGNQITVVTTITYPTTEGNLTWGFEVKGDPDTGGSTDSEEKPFSKDAIETVLKNGQMPVSIFPIVGYMEVNADKTKLKVTATLKEGDENWGDVKKFVGMGTFEGDMKITSEPTQITVEQYYNKQ
ncbi:MAG: hypothetical protein MST11_07155 [Spirochaetia bacterium]|nr:hypothetical protein [Spirochaetia bacterium]